MHKKLLALTLPAALPFAASAAEGLSYNYVEGGYVATNTDVGDADGWGINGSGAISDNFHVFGGFTSREDGRRNHRGVRFDASTRPVARRAWATTIRSRRTPTCSPASPTRATTWKATNLDGYSAEVGVRSALAPNFEGYVTAGYEDGDAFDGDFYGRVGAQVKFNQNWGVSGDVKFAEGDTQYFIGPRLTF
jgi:Ax21 family sulfation-dependent quorum factor